MAWQKRRPIVTSNAQASKAWIVWDPALEAYRMHFPFDRGVIDFLKKHIPYEKRNWNPATKEWIFVREYLDAMRLLLSAFPDVKIITEEQVRASDAASNASQIRASADSITDAKTKFRELCGSELPAEYTSARRVYLTAIKRLHPDVGGCPDATAELNRAWNKIKQEVFHK